MSATSHGRSAITTSAPSCGAGSGDLTASCIGDRAAVADAIDTVIAAAREFGLPAAINGHANLLDRVQQGVRMFVSIGAGSCAPEEDLRRAAGR